MNPTIKQGLADFLLAMADDELILGHRDSEWCGIAPILEEDIAFANLALDEIGHAAVWYTLLAELIGRDAQQYPDQLVYTRLSPEWRCAQFVEQPKGDWAFSMLRQYLFDASEIVRLQALQFCTYSPIKEAAAKIRKEEFYHQRHTRAWVERLSLGSDEGNRRMQAALDLIWPFSLQIFRWTETDRELSSQSWIPVGEDLHQEWEAEVRLYLHNCSLTVPAPNGEVPPRTVHSAHLKILLDEMQSVARLDPEATW